MTVAHDSFKSHISQSRDAIEIYEYLKPKGYHADFGLRFVWVSVVSALDHYISQLIVERATEHFATGTPFSAKLLNDSVPISGLMKLYSANSLQAVLEFRTLISQNVRFRTFQKADDIADGLAMIWNESQKWSKISSLLGIKDKNARYKLNSIAYRRDLIVHNADYDESSGNLTDCKVEDAKEVVNYVSRVVEAIDHLVK